MISINEELMDHALSHSIDFTRYNNGIVRRMIALLNKVDADIFAQLMTLEDRLSPANFTVERLDALLQDVRRINEAAYNQLRMRLDSELKDLVSYEAGYQMSLFQNVLPVQFSVAAVSVEQVYSAALSRPMQGRLMAEWSKSIEADKMMRIRDALRIGYVEGQTIGQMVTRIRGTKARGYEDGLIELDRRSAAAVVRTATAHVAGVTRDRFYDANASLIKGICWLSTLDSRTTTEWCIPRDGKLYSLDHKPQGHSLPWLAGPGRLHWGCRSSSFPIIRSWKELNIDLPEMDESTRASMDGQVPESLSYLEWLKKQSAARQDDILGPTRGLLLRKGDLEIDRFYDQSGKWLTLEELAKKNQESFSKAGLKA